MGVIAQFGGQTPLNLADKLKEEGVNILGTTPEVIDLAEDRDQFRKVMDKLGIPMAESGMASTVEQAIELAHEIGYPVMVRPSFVLGGRGMEVVHDDDQMKDYMAAAIGVTPDRPILIDRFLHNALECEADSTVDDETNLFDQVWTNHYELFEDLAREGYLENTFYAQNKSYTTSNYSSAFIGSSEQKTCPMSTPLVMFFDYTSSNPIKSQKVKGLSDVIFTVDGGSDLDKARTLKNCWSHTDIFGEIKNH